MTKITHGQNQRTKNTIRRKENSASEPNEFCAHSFSEYNEKSTQNIKLIFIYSRLHSFNFHQNFFILFSIISLIMSFISDLFLLFL